ncbi:MAG: VOC family protein [Actinomycetota bacterium]|nr:VOC family protein [Actinomycetota bacterium]
MASVLREIVVDCEDPRRTAQFWAEVLGWPVAESEEGYFWLSSTGEAWAPPPILVFVAVPEPKTVKNRLHLDLNPSGCDQADELARLLSLGAKRISVGEADVPWVVLADPEGNEFCLLARRVDAR